MQKFGLVIDSTTVLEQKVLDKFDIEIVDLNVIVNGESFPERSLSDAQVLHYFDAAANMKTGSPSPAAFVAAYDRLYEKGYRDIVVLPISSGLSSTYQSAVMGIELFERSNTNIKVIDTKLANVGYTTLLDTFWSEIAAGIDINEFVTEVEKRSVASTLEFTVTDLKHLHRSGRLSRLAALAAELLRIKPVVKMADGQLHMIGRVRTTKNVIQLFEDAIKDILGSYKKIALTVVSIGENRLAPAVAEELKGIFPQAEIKMLTRVNPVFMVSLGREGYGFAATAY